jgi:hypothetical protein
MGLGPAEARDDLVADATVEWSAAAAANCSISAPGSTVKADMISQGGSSAMTGVGYPVWLDRQQWVLAARRRPDLLCRFTESGAGGVRANDWPVIELKAITAGLAAVYQLAGYLEAVRSELAAGKEKVVGLLISDGSLPGVVDQLAARGLGYETLSRIDYRREVAARRGPHA